MRMAVVIKPLDESGDECVREFSVPDDTTTNDVADTVWLHLMDVYGSRDENDNAFARLP